MKFTTKNGSDLRPVEGDFVTTTLIELAASGMNRIPSNVVFLIDASSSMGGSKWSMVKQAVEDRIQKALFIDGMTKDLDY